jgi:transcriptional regulator with PAS, ATPase and Fis domain
MQAWLSNANNLLSELRIILQTLSEGILLLRYDGVISQMNAPAGTMLGLTPSRVTGRKLQDVLPLPQVLTRALQARQALSYEEIVFDTVRGRLPYLCTLKPITSYQAELDIDALTYSVAQTVVEPASADGFVLILRSIERVQKLVHRMTGAHARLSFSHVIGESMLLKEAVRRARLAANSNATVLLHGETGTGKEIFAQSIHNDSVRADGPFVAINCAAIPRELITTELFGYEGGAFTGADRQGRPGKFEQAHKGTLFLDEIGDMPLDLQANLLRAIETRTVVRIGGQRVISADVRIIAATHKNLREEVQRGNFRSDLYYRLNVLTIEIPALRERIDDIPLLVQHFLQRQSRILERPLTISSEALATLKRHHWPGNVRELENMLERVTHLTSHSNITVEDLPLHLAPPPASSVETMVLASLDLDLDAIYGHIQADNPTKENQPNEETRQSISSAAELRRPLKEQSRNTEAQAILQAWQQSNRNIGQTAALLGINRTTLWRKMRKYGISKTSDV